ncbi:MAG: GFA family protein [Pseudomonadales bacterium]|nr:GFA family protein [Pseudomonadales bacterium]
MAIHGSCLCGGVTFEVDRVTGPFEFCHCRRCRKVSGSTGMAAVGVRKRDFRFLSGRELIETYEAPILYAPPSYTSVFCRRCGSQVPLPEPADEWFEIAAGLFDDDLNRKLDKHIFVELTPDWDEITGDLPRYTREEIIAWRRSPDQD